MTHATQNRAKDTSSLAPLLIFFGTVLILAFIPIQTSCYDTSLGGFGNYLRDVLFAPIWVIFGGVTESSMLIRFGLSSLGIFLTMLGVVLHGLSTSLVRALLNVIFLASCLLIVFLGYFALGVWMCF